MCVVLHEGAHRTHDGIIERARQAPHIAARGIGQGSTQRLDRFVDRFRLAEIDRAWRTGAVDDVGSIAELSERLADTFDGRIERAVRRELNEGTVGRYRRLHSLQSHRRGGRPERRTSTPYLRFDLLLPAFERRNSLPVLVSRRL